MTWFNRQSPALPFDKLTNRLSKGQSSIIWPRPPVFGLRSANRQSSIVKSASRRPYGQRQSLIVNRQSPT
ncbi:MAG: hypothetical protein MUD01_10550 [Chloroflexaceae bacterium]|nr:hypothetical protein [Chloroflexaceae bacterium]